MVHWCQTTGCSCGFPYVKYLEIISRNIHPYILISASKIVTGLYEGYKEVGLFEKVVLDSLNDKTPNSSGSTCMLFYTMLKTLKLCHFYVP